MVIENKNIFQMRDQEICCIILAIVIVAVIYGYYMQKSSILNSEAFSCKRKLDPMICLQDQNPNKKNCLNYLNVYDHQDFFKDYTYPIADNYWTSVYRSNRLNECLNKT